MTTQKHSLAHHKKRRSSLVPDAEELLRIMAVQCRPLRLDSLLRVLHLARHARRDLKVMLTGLAASGFLLRLRGGLWVRPQQLQEITGRYFALRGGGGFVIPLRHPDTAGRQRLQSDNRHISIPAASTGGAWHQDVVRVALAPRSRQRRSLVGKIVAVVQRSLQEVPAITAQYTEHTLFCTPADSRLPIRFRVELGNDVPAPGTLVLLAPLEQVTSDIWSARLLTDYGREDTVAVQEALVKINHQVPRDFPPEVHAEVTALPASVTPEDCFGRKDLRTLPFVTIDGTDARDYDDAIHVETLPDGGWLLRVAIADVSHYVRPRCRDCMGALDAEARKRGNSRYFPCSVEPMLPEVLCQNLCSLIPGQDRLAVLVELPFSSTGQPGSPIFSLAVIRSAARLTYDVVKACLLDKDQSARNAFCRENPQGADVLAMLARAFALYERLRFVRQQRGSLFFDLPEADCRVDTSGRVAWLGLRQHHDAHRLIEEFMIAANEAVSRHLRDGCHPFLSRVHPAPKADQLRSLRAMLMAVGVTDIPSSPNVDMVRWVLMAVRGTPREYLVNRLCLRAMPQARYDPFPAGHYGLASTAYCHFTSPIRRYADLLVHRVLKASLGVNVGSVPAGQKLLRVAEMLNTCERSSQEAEREMTRRLACLALRTHVGEHFTGVVSGVMAFGIFVTLNGMPVEGMIHIEDLGDDWYDFKPIGLRLVGQRTGVVWCLGQCLDVRLVDVHLGRLEIRLQPLTLPTSLRRSSQSQHALSRKRVAVRTFSDRDERHGNEKTRSSYHRSFDHH